METITGQKLRCSHCGEACTTDRVTIADKPFCCEGCKMVYQLLEGKGLCNYYDLNDRPGINQRIPVRTDKFAFLDDEKIVSDLITFRNEEEVHVNLYLPQIHCSSCLYLLEHLHQLNGGVISSRVDFAARQISVILDPGKLTLRQLAELLTAIGYEPYISLRDLAQPPPPVQKSMIYQLGIAGFCFANIMLLSFPEYLGLDRSDLLFQRVFRSLNLALSIPVFLYSAQPFYLSAWKSLRHKFLNIDAPIVLAILVTFFRSAVEVMSGKGAGYFDSMTGIVFFMLAGRMLQNRTYRQLSFDRDYTSYFPIAVTYLQKDKLSGQQKELTRALPDIRCGDELLIHHGEIIPADGILTRGEGLIDYSFVTGESVPVPKAIGEIVYAGGRQTGAAMEILVVKEVAQSYLTQLWNRQGDKKQQAHEPGRSMIRRGPGAPSLQY
ncbi:MAG: heavy metal translocating P-type ATPase metal-binding domain-containing protein [Bacteroidota bacterium]